MLMKKIFSFAILLAGTLHALNAGDMKPVSTKIATPAEQKITATNSEVITSTPEGTLIDPLYCASEASYFIYSSALVSMSNNGYAGAMVRTDDAIYIRNIISQYSSSYTYWVKGDIGEDGSVTFQFPQLIYHNDANPASDRYVAMLTPHVNGESITLEAEEGNCDLRMKWEGNRLVQVIPEIADPTAKKYAGMIGLIDSSGDFKSFGELGISYKVADLKPLEAPADIQTSRYIFNYRDGDRELKSNVITIGTSGNEVWFKGLNTFIPEAWVKGTLNNGVVSIPSTYTGIYDGYLTYVTGLSDDNKRLVTPLTLTKTDQDYTADATVFINIGDETVDLNSNRVFKQGTMTPYIEGTKTPTTPVIDTSEEGTEAFDENEGMGALIFTFDPVDTEGYPLDQSKLYYNIYSNGKLHTFNKDLYGLDQDMTDIPYAFQSDFIMSMYGYFFVFFLEDMDSIGVRAVYKDGDNTTYSGIATYHFRESGIDAATVFSKAVSEEYLNLNGQKVANPDKGIYIKIMHYPDGSRKACKVAIH